VKDRFLRLQISDLLFERGYRERINGKGRYLSAPLDFFVEFNTLIAHRTPSNLETETLIGR
jgi:hypothetical protein